MKRTEILVQAAVFFEDREQALQIAEKFSDYSSHTDREWRLEYDYLFRGMDGDWKFPLWASVIKGEKVLQNPTTLEVIREYHANGYQPVLMDGNPADYVGEQMRYLAYLSAAGAEKAYSYMVNHYTLEQVKAILQTAEERGTFEGILDYLKNLVLFLAGMEGEYSFPAISREMETSAGMLAKEAEQTGLRAELPTEEAHEIMTGGWNNCGGKCVIRPVVQENCILSIGSDISSNNPQIRACVRGRGYRKTFLSQDRLRYPMKRVGKRGSGKFERITWEEAADYVADNIRRLRAKYGPSALYVHYATGVTGVMRGSALISRLLSLDGGYLGAFNSYSSACSTYISRYIFGNPQYGHSPADLLNTKLVILWGDNSSETIFGSERHMAYAQLKDLGVKIISIDPRYSQTAIAYADEWIPIRPSTDAALADAMAYVIWKEGLQDQKFMDKYCIGFDEEHMPEGIPANESYYAYLFGMKDGVEKTPEWAEEITGVPADKIREIAILYASTKPACIMAGLGPQRNGGGEQIQKGISMLCCLCGNVGIPGGSSGGSGFTAEHNNPGRSSDNVYNPYPGQIPVFLWTKAIEHGTEMTPKGDRLTGVDHLDSNIKMVFNLAGNCLTNQHADVNDTIRILSDDTKCESIVTSDIFLTPSARMSDIVLPATSVFESRNLTAPWRGSNYLIYNNPCIDPLFDCRFEWEWIKEVAQRLGHYDRFINGMPDLEDWIKESYAILRTKEPELPEYEEMARLGGWQYKEPVHYIAFEKEIADPENHPFATPSGKIEIFSKALWDFEQDDIPAIPKHIDCPDGPRDPLREKYPLQLMGWHTRRRCHSIHDNNEWQDEVEKPGLWIHPEDAAERGICTGDLVRVWNDHGTVEIPAVVTKRIMKGVTGMSQGGWHTPDKKGVDRRGSINVLTAVHPTPLAKGNPQHTNLVEVVKA